MLDFDADCLIDAPMHPIQPVPPESRRMDVNL